MRARAAWAASIFILVIGIVAFHEPAKCARFRFPGGLQNSTERCFAKPTTPILIGNVADTIEACLALKNVYPLRFSKDTPVIHVAKIERLPTSERGQSEIEFADFPQSRIGWQFFMSAQHKCRNADFEQKSLSSTDIYNNYGEFNALSAPDILGQPDVSDSNPRTERQVDLILQQRVLSLAGVPQLVGRVLEPQCEGRNCDSSGGGPERRTNKSIATFNEGEFEKIVFLAMLLLVCAGLGAYAYVDGRKDKRRDS